MGIPLHVVAQVIESEFVVGAVGDVFGIGDAAGLIVHVGQDRSDTQPQHLEYRSHPRCVAFGQIIVDGDDMDTFAFQSIEVSGRDAREGFSFSGLHRQYLALMQDNRAHDLFIVMAFPKPEAFHALERRSLNTLEGPGGNLFFESVV